ncbi:MAG: GNAT acetyltransferase 2-domain-containing protein [Piptocephalis tieghemiana]|nr:MAG: GNAT acetyltransferase 2-domain-containing protein [Piptocephalis tieghemiana]
MVKKVLDSRINTLVTNSVRSNQRSFFVLVGDKGKDQVVNLHYLLSKAKVAARPSVLWCYKKDLGFTSHRKKREKRIKQEVKSGKREVNEADPFELFVSTTNIRYTYYKETQKILGNTYGMCVLQDFEALTPNLLARTVETVEGGGMVVLLLRTMSSLKQLYTMTMDVHSRYRTEAHGDVTARFNERFILSLGGCEACLVLDDELNVLPISRARSIKPLPAPASKEAPTHGVDSTELADLKSSLVDTQPVGSLVSTARTMDQARAILTFVEAISEKTLRSTVALTAARGRGKSASLGVAMASAVAFGYSNIFVTSPSPENLRTLFDFVFKAFDALGYEEHMDYDIVQSTNPDFNKAIVRVNIFRQHRQTIQYIQPQDAHTLGQAELLVIDEAAAIPLPLVRALIGPYLVFMASTVNGYEGTGRSLSLKLIDQLREQSRGFVGRQGETHVDDQGAHVDRSGKARKDTVGEAAGGRVLREVKLEEPIRYAAGDPTEAWLNGVLCLDAKVPNNIQGLVHPAECELYLVNRDTLFSYNKFAEEFLQRMMALYVEGHYKNQPNDLQLMSDAPAHQLFVLTERLKSDTAHLPQPICVIQVALEGEISRESVIRSLGRGQRAAGDIIPWLISQQYQDEDFATLSGARVVRIATHPRYAKMGYGGRALDLLIRFYQGEFVDPDATGPLLDPLGRTNIHHVSDHDLKENKDTEDKDDLRKEEVKQRDARSLPPLLNKLERIRAPRLNWVGVSYGLTASLHKFWKKSGFTPVYLRQTPNELTGEHSCVMLRTLDTSDLPRQCSPEWLSAFSQDFSRRFLSLLAYQFRSFQSVLALSILGTPGSSPFPITQEDLAKELSGYDLKRLDSYASNMLDYHVVTDLLPLLASWYFSGRLATPTDQGEGQGGIHLSGVQGAVLLAMGLQKKDVDGISEELHLPVSQILALFVKVCRKISSHFKSLELNHALGSSDQSRLGAPLVGKDSSESAAPGPGKALGDEEAWDPVEEPLENELEDAGREALQERQKAMLGDVSKYAIKEEDTEGWAEAEKQVSKRSKTGSTLVSIKSSSGDRNDKKRRRILKGEGVAQVVKEAEADQQKRSKRSISKKARH